MFFQSSCPSCGYRTEVAERLRGREVKCPRCREPFRLGGTGAKAPAVTSGSRLAGLVVGVLVGLVGGFSAAIGFFSALERSAGPLGKDPLLMIPIFMVVGAFVGGVVGVKR